MKDTLLRRLASLQRWYQQRRKLSPQRPIFSASGGLLNDLGAHKREFFHALRPLRSATDVIMRNIRSTEAGSKLDFSIGFCYDTDIACEQNLPFDDEINPNQSSCLRSWTSHFHEFGA